MAVKVVSDLLDDKLSHDKGGVKVDRVFFVSLDTPDANPYNNQINALNATDSVSGLAVPLLGAVYPGSLLNYIYCTNRSIENLGSSTEFKIVIHYEVIVWPVQPSTTPLIRIGGTSNEVETNLDYSGAAITVDYAAGGTYTLKSADTTPQGGTIKKNAAQIVITATRIENTEPDPTPWVDHINSGSVQIGKKTYAAQTLLCKAVNGEPQQADGTHALQYLVTYEFQADLTGNLWGQTVFWESADGVVPSDSVAGGRGTTTVQVYPTANFSTLALNT